MAKVKIITLRDVPRTRNFYVYILTDPRDMRPFYVGVSVDPVERLKNHIRAAKRNHVPCASGKYIRAMIESGFQPQMTIVETITIGTSSIESYKPYRCERYWINSLKSRGHVLTNDKKNLDIAS